MSQPSARRLRTIFVSVPLVVGLGIAALPAVTSTAVAAPVQAAAAAAPQPAAPTASRASVGGLEVENSFVSAVGWVKPGDAYPSRILLTNPTGAAVLNASVTVQAPAGATFTAATAPAGTTALRTDPEVTWTVPAVAPGATLTLILEQEAASLAEEPTLVWRDLSTTASVTVGAAQESVGSHGPKVIPPDENYDTARYGDRPFPVVPVQYRDRAYQTTHARDLDTVINDPAFPGSTYNLFQEMSLGQLYPHGTVPSDGTATADFAGYAPGFPFSQIEPGQTCAGGLTQTGGVPVPGLPTSPGGAAYTERITDGLYNLPGNTAYYGADANGSALIGALAGVGALQNIDSGCGSAGKMVYDAAAIADPEIDYSDYDTDKDGVVDFFMAVFAGCGGNGASQMALPGDPLAACPYGGVAYDNVWPHSSSLEYYYSDETTGLPGFTTDDQLKNLEDQPLWYRAGSFSPPFTTTDRGDANRVLVRVGPYNVNPETAIDAASVISHEYGHSLGLPDFYSTGGRETYGDWNLMATDKSQNMDAFSRQELGWVVPEVLPTSGTKSVEDWTNSKQDTDEITWQAPDGTAYVLEEGVDGRVQNSQMYVAKLPGRQLLSESAFDTLDTASKSHTWWSGSGNGFGCAPEGGRNFDLSIPALADAPAGSVVTLSLKSMWNIEWDFDYGYVMTTVDGGKNYASQPSANGYTTSNAGVPGNANQNACQAKYDNGITGSSASYKAGTAVADRLTGTYGEPGFVADSFDISELAGQAQGALRFSYATDPGLARPGWFIDDLKVTVDPPGDATAPYDVLVSDFETSGGPDDPRVFNGGCRENLSTAQKCTLGWRYLEAGSESAQDHAYYLEMRDRSGFDFDGRGQADRGAAAFEAGLYLSYTDEAHGYGNAGTDDPPAQSPLDSTPVPGSATPELADAAFTAAAGRSAYTDSGAGHTDNYADPSTTSGNWEFKYGCLGFRVDSMSGQDAASASNLTGDVTFTMGAGCGPFNYGYAPDAPAAANTAPTAKATATPANAKVGQDVTLSADGSTDAQSPNNLTYSWDFGDGGSAKDATGKTVTHKFTAAGSYQPKVTVSDPEGMTASATTSVAVSAAGSGTGNGTGNGTGTGPSTGTGSGPVARIKVKPKHPTADHKVRFLAKLSTGAGLTYAWNFHNGGKKADAKGKRVKKLFTRVGQHRVTLTVTDSSGAKASATKQFRVYPAGSDQATATRTALRGLVDLF